MANEKKSSGRITEPIESLEFLSPKTGRFVSVEKKPAKKATKKSTGKK